MPQLIEPTCKHKENAAHKVECSNLLSSHASPKKAAHVAGCLRAVSQFGLIYIVDP